MSEMLYGYFTITLSMRIQSLFETYYEKAKLFTTNWSHCQ